MNKNRTHRWLGYLAAGLLAVTLAGCGGDDPTGPQGEQGGSGSTGPSGPPGPPGVTGNFNVTFVTPQEWEAAQFVVSDVSITTDDKPPVVEFTVRDSQGRWVVGLETITSTGDGRGNTYGQVDGKQIVGLPNLSFAIAKLMPRTDAKPSSWVSYIVTTVPTTTSTSVTATRPSTDNTGTLEAVPGKPGSYKYTFFRNVSGTEALVNGLTLTGNNRRSDLGDLAWQPGLPHRLTIQLGGAAPGTGTNTPNGVQVTAAVNMANPVNFTFDYVPTSGKVLAPSELTREDVSIDNCNVCHGKLAIHGGDEAQGIPNQRVEVRYCVVCHTDQRAYGRAQVTSKRDKDVNGFDSITFPKLTETASVNPITGITSFKYSPPTYVADGEVAGNFTTMIHKLHQGHTLVKQNYNYADLAFNNKGFSKLNDGQKMCTTCHAGSEATTSENYRKVPSRTSCGACHDGIAWATGTGATLGDKQKVVYATDALPTTGHRGGAALDDGSCKACHTPDNIKIAHRTQNITPNNPAIEPGLAVFTYDIASAAVNATTNDVSIKFRILKQIADSTGQVKDVKGEYVKFLPPAVQPSPPNPALILDGFTGSPSFVLAWAMKQDEIGNPIDYNNQMTNADDGKQNKQAQPLTVAISALLNTNAGATVPSINTVGSLSEPDSEGFYTATLRGNGSAVCGDSSSRMKCVFPVGAKLRAVGLQGYFSQVSGPAAPPRSAVPREAISIVKSVNGDTSRRVVVDKQKCAGCHEWLELHGGNRVLDPQMCVMCHVPGLATSGRGIADAANGTFPGLNNWVFDIASTRIVNDWKFDKTAVNAALKFPVTSNNFKDMIHGIHAGRDRVTPFQDARDRTSTTSPGGGVIQLLDFRRMDFPGKLKNCETCHVTATVTAASYNTIPSGSLASTYESIDGRFACAIKGFGFDTTSGQCSGTATATPADAKRSLVTANLTDTVTTPFTAACVSCHDGSAAKAHMAINGGQLNVPRATALPKGRPLEDVESCAVCHGPGREFDTAKVHK